MERGLRMTIDIPKEQEENFRIFAVLHGGAIKEVKEKEDPEP